MPQCRNARGSGCHNAREIVAVDSLYEAQQWMRKNRRPDDVVLVENDLPDLYECRFRL